MHDIVGWILTGIFALVFVRGWATQTLGERIASLVIVAAIVYLTVT